MSARRDLSEARVGFFKTTIEASDALEHQPTVWPVPLLRIRPAISPWQWQPWTAVSALLRPWQTKIHCRGHFVADTNVSPFARARNICYGHKKCFWFCSETFCVCNQCFPVCAAQETSWATMCPQQCALVYQGLFDNNLFCEVLYEIIHICTAVVDESEEWSSQ